MRLLRGLLWFLPVPHGAATITTEDAGGLSLFTWLLQLDPQFPTRSAHYDLAGIASARRMVAPNSPGHPDRSVMEDSYGHAHRAGSLGVKNVPGWKWTRS